MMIGHQGVGVPGSVEVAVIASDKAIHGPRHYPICTNRRITDLFHCIRCKRSRWIP